MRFWLVLLALQLSACGGPREESDEASISNQAESLERAANATVDRQIKEIEDDAAAEGPAENAIQIANNSSAE